MHNLLREYLSELAAHLSTLPPKRRTEELREVRTHLENAVIVGRELGRTEDEAAREGVAQYGAADVVGQEMTAAWRRGRDLNMRGMVSAAACAVGVTVVLARMTPLLGSVLPPAPAQGLLMPPYSLGHWAAGVVWLMPLGLIVGGVSGLLFPRRAVAGVVVGLDVLLLCFLMGGSDAVSLLTGGAVPVPSVHDNGDTLQMGFTAGAVLIAGAAVAAWAVSRGRTAGQRRGRQAAAK